MIDERDPRAVAMSRCSFHATRVALDGVPLDPDLATEARIDPTAAAALLNEARLVDQSSGIWRLRLTDAIEAAARARVGNDAYWTDTLTESGREEQRTIVRPVVEAAFLGGVLDD